MTFVLETLIVQMTIGSEIVDCRKFSSTDAYDDENAEDS